MSTVILDPRERALPDRAELDLDSDGIRIDQEGVDWGDAEIVAFMAEMGSFGEAMIDYRLPNRKIVIPLIVEAGAVIGFDDARILLQAKASRFNEQGGPLKRILRSGRYVFADVTSAKLHLGGDWFEGNRDVDRTASLEFEAFPDFYEERVDLDAQNFAGKIGGAWTEQIRGNLPGRADLHVRELAGIDQLGLGYHFRCRHYVDDPSARWMYEAEELTPLPGASRNGDVFNSSSLHELSSYQLNNITASPVSEGQWASVLNTNRLPTVAGVGTVASGVGDITPALPTSTQRDDILVMYVETATEAVNVPAGWAHVADSPVTNAVGTATKLSVLWKRAVDGEAAPRLTDPGDHQIARIVAVRHCIREGDPWDVTSAGTEAVSDRTVLFPGDTTTVDGCLLMLAVATGSDVTSTSNFNVVGDASGLRSSDEIIDNWTASGNGGGLGVAAVLKAEKGAYGGSEASLANAAEKAMHTMALKPEADGGFLTHSGTYDVWARAWAGVAGDLRLLWDVGDMISPTANDPAPIPAAYDASGSVLVPLGQVILEQMPVGPHRWQGIVQYKGDAGATSCTVDALFFFDADEASGILRTNPNIEIELEGASARDDFNQTVGTLPGKGLDVGGTWAEAGTDPTGFSVPGTSPGYAYRTAISDVNTGAFIDGRLAVASDTAGMTDQAIAIDMKAEIVAPPLYSLKMGAVGRYTDVNNFVGAAVWWVGFPLPYLLIIKRLGGVETILGLIPNPQIADNVYSTILLAISATGQWRAGLATTGASLPPITVQGYDADLAAGSGKAVAAGQAGFLDHYASATANRRYYANFRVGVPTFDAVLFGDQAARIRYDRHIRKGPDGAAYGDVGIPTADMARIPVSGPERRPVEIALKASRGGFDQVPDSHVADGVEGQLGYYPCWSYIPEEL